MKKKMEPEELESMGYKMHVHLKHDELMPFVREHLFSNDGFSIFYWIFNIILVIGIVVTFVFSTGSFSHNFDGFCLGFLA